MNEILIKDGGPIELLSIPCEPGITVLRGPNDEGKSEALKLCDRLNGGKQKVSKRHDAAGAGSVEGFGAKVTLGGSVRHTGTLEAYSMSGRFDIGELIQPPIKEPVAADKVRIRSFLALTNAEADITLFGDGAHENATEKTTRATDLVEMASGLKADYEVLARQHEEEAAIQEGSAAACGASTEGVDLIGESDAVALQHTVEAAVAEKARTDELFRSITKAKDRSTNARGILDKAESEYSGLSVEEADHEIETSELAYKDAVEFMGDLEGQLRDANQTVENLRTKVNVSMATKGTAQLHENTLARCRKAIEESANVGDLTTEEMESATDALAAAHEAVKQGALIRNAKEALANKANHQANAKSNREHAEALRLSAKATEQVLSDAVQSDELTVKDGRLVTNKDGKEVFFADRSRGYRCRVAMTIAAAKIREAGAEKAAIIVLPQEHWEGLDIDARTGLAEQAKTLGVTIITAEASSREGDPKKLTATTF